jgi:hypothetical protein
MINQLPGTRKCNQTVNCIALKIFETRGFFLRVFVRQQQANGIDRPTAVSFTQNFFKIQTVNIAPFFVGDVDAYSRID